MSNMIAMIFFGDHSEDDVEDEENSSCYTAMQSGDEGPHEEPEVESTSRVPHEVRDLSGFEDEEMELFQQNHTWMHDDSMARSVSACEFVESTIIEQSLNLSTNIAQDANTVASLKERFFDETQDVGPGFGYWTPSSGRCKPLATEVSSAVHQPTPPWWQQDEVNGASSGPLSDEEGCSSTSTETVLVRGMRRTGCKRTKLFDRVHIGGTPLRHALRSAVPKQ